MKTVKSLLERFPELTLELINKRVEIPLSVNDAVDDVLAKSIIVSQRNKKKIDVNKETLLDDLYRRFPNLTPEFLFDEYGVDVTDSDRTFLMICLPEICADALAYKDAAAQERQNIFDEANAEFQKALRNERRANRR